MLLFGLITCFPDSSDQGGHQLGRSLCDKPAKLLTMKGAETEADLCTPSVKMYRLPRKSKKLPLTLIYDSVTCRRLPVHTTAE